MRKALAIVYRALACALATAPIMLIAGIKLTGDWRGPALWTCYALAMAVLLAHIPARAHPASLLREVARKRRRGFPVRLPAILLAALLPFPFLPIPLALITASLLLLALRDALTPHPLFTALPGLAAGLVIHLAAAVVVYTLDLPALTAPLYALAAAFFAAALFTLNADSLDIGYAAHARLRPAPGVRRANRGLLLILCALIAVAASFDRIRAWVASAALALARALAQLILWLMSLVRLEQTGPSSIEDGGLGALPQGTAKDPGLLAQILYYVALTLAALAFAALMFFALRALLRKLRALMRRLLAQMKRFTRTLGEDYVDDRQSLLDGGELRRAVQQTAQKALRRLQRPPRWDQLTPTEKVRYRVRTLYQKSPQRAQLPPLTITEAAPLIGATPNLTDLYDQARYGHTPLTGDDIQNL